VSQPGEGATFTLYLPLTYSPAVQTVRPAAPPTMNVRSPAAAQADGETVESVVDDRDDIEAGDCVTLIVEDDPRFASILLGLARDSGFKAW
jgi:hypothetical protein